MNIEAHAAPSWSAKSWRNTAGRTGILVVSGDLGALGVVRSLGRKGIPVWYLQNGYCPLARVSRYTERSLGWPALDELGQRDYLLELCDRYRLDDWVLFPDGDNVAALVARHHEMLGARFRLSTPPWEILCQGYDKRLTYRLAAQLGVDYPWTRHPSSVGEAEALECAFPVILKPATKASDNALTVSKAWRVDNRQELLDRFREACTFMPADVIMVQELIPGGGECQFSYAALCLEGRPLAVLVARRTRQHPLDFGAASTYVETVERPEIEEPARRLLAAMRYTGVVEVEFKQDPRDGRYKLLDINARIWTWHSLARRAGVDFPYLLWRMINGLPVSEVRARSGVSWIHMVPDLKAAAQAIRRGSFQPGAYLASFRGPLESAVLALDDPLPALAEVPLLSYRRWRRARRLKKFGDAAAPTD